MKIGFLQLGQIGDMVLCTPAFAEIKKKYPDAELCVVSGRSNAVVLKGNPNVKKIIRLVKTPSGLLKFLLRLRSIKFDYWIDHKNHYSTESRWIAKYVNAKTKISFTQKNYNNGVNKFFTDIVFDALQCLDISKPEEPVLPDLYLNNEVRELAEQTLMNNGKKNILINVSASSEKRLYSAENWDKVIAQIDMDKANVYINAMPAEKETVLFLYNKYVDLQVLPPLHLMEVAAIIEKSDLIITPDTSIVHIAAAFRKKIIALHNDDGANFEKFATNNPNAIKIKVDGGSYLNQIPPEMIIENINKLLIS